MQCEVHVLASIIPQKYAIYCNMLFRLLTNGRTKKTACRMLIFIRKGKKEKVFVFSCTKKILLHYFGRSRKGEEELSTKKTKRTFLCVREEKPKTKLSIFKVTWRHMFEVIFLVLPLWIFWEFFCGIFLKAFLVFLGMVD